MSVGEQISLFDRDLWFSRTCWACFPQTTEKILEPSLNRPQELPITTPQFLDLRTDRAGVTLGAFWEIGFLSLGAYTIASFGEYPSAVVESHLSQILEDKPHPKYFLSARACQGILDRLNREGEIAPPQIEQALIHQAKQ